MDIIAIDYSEKLPFRLKQPMVKAAIKVCSLLDCLYLFVLPYFKSIIKRFSIGRYG